MRSARGDVTDRWEQEKALCIAWFQPDLTDEDRSWLAGHLELIGQKPPKVDTSWMTMESIR